MDQAIYRDALSLQEGCPFLCLSSLSGGYPETRMVFNLRALARSGEVLLPPFRGHEGDFEAWVGTNTSSRKASQLRVDGRSCLYYSDSAGFRGLTVVGDMAVVEDPAVKAALWREGWESYYPGGPLDEDYAVLHFRPLRARYSHGFAVTELDLDWVSAGQAGHD